MNNIYTDMENKPFKIIASFASINVDSQSKKLSNIKYSNKFIDNVVASTIFYNEDIYFNKIYDLLNLLSKQTSITLNKKLIILNITNNSSINSNIIINNEFFKVIDINFYKFLYDIFNNKSDVLNIEKELLENNYKNIKLNNLNYLINLNLINLFKDETFDSISMEYEIIFIFNDIAWSNLVGLFKLRGINLYGGSTSRRHLLSTVQARLSSFLLLLNDLKINNNLIYQSFNRIKDSKDKFDLELDKIINLNVPFYELDNYKNINYNKYTFLRHNFIYHIIIKIFNINNDIINLNNNLYLINSNIREDNDRYNRYINEDNNFSTKKIKNIEIRKVVNNDKVKELLAQIKNLKSEFNFLSLILYKLNNNLFNTDGTFKLDNQIKVLLKDLDSFDLYHKDFNYNLEKEKLIQKELNINNENINNENINTNDNIYNKTINNVNSKSFNLSNSISKREYSTHCINLQGNENTNKNTNKNNTSDNKISNLFNFDDIKISKKSKEDQLNNVFLSLLSDIINVSSKDPFSSQIKFEEYWVENIIKKIDTIDNKYRKNFVNIIKKAEETLILIKDNNGLNRRFPELGNKINKRHLIITYSILTSYFRIQGFTSIAFMVSKNILYDIYWNEINKLKKENDNIIYSFEDFCLNLEIDKTYELKLGAYFIEIFCRKPTALFERSYKSENLLESEINDTDLAVLTINKDFSESLENNLIISPTSLPMLCIPNKWSDKEFGGFLTNKKIKNSIITGNKLHKHKIEKKEPLYNAINKLNSIKFKINKKLLDFLENEGKPILKYFFINLKNNTDINHNLTTLNLAKIYSKLDNPFFISNIADWRGRIYTQSFYISHQGAELSNAVLNLYEGKPLNEEGLKYLYIYGANCYDDYNISRKSIHLRIQWVKDNYEKIISLDQNFILKSKSLFLFTSFCLIMKDLHLDPKAKVYLPIFLDATCSGIQHLSALILDYTSASKVNLIPQNEFDNVGDIYSSLVNGLNLVINKYGLNNNEYKKFSEIKLTRKDVKRPIMTKLYNVTIHGVSDQMKQNFEFVIKDKQKIYKVPTEKGFVELNEHHIFKLAQLIFQHIFTELPTLEIIYDYLKKIVSICERCEIPIVWITPSGLEITQEYSLSIAHRVSISFNRKSKSVVIKDSTNKVDRKKQVQAIIPNIIHSLDASHLINIINNGLTISSSPIITVHDCFGTHPNEALSLKNLVIQEFINLYTNTDFLGRFHERILQTLSDFQYHIFKDEDGKSYIKPKRIKIYIPELPPKGKLNLNKIKQSQYMIN